MKSDPTQLTLDEQLIADTVDEPDEDTSSAQTEEPSPLSDREKQLLEIVKRLINVVTSYVIYQDTILKSHKWQLDASEQIGFTLDWQEGMLKFLDSEFGLKYTRLDLKKKDEKE